MKKIFGYIIVLAVVAIPVVSFAAEFRASNQPSVMNNEHITNDMYMAGGTISSAGNIDGDLVTAGGTIVISGNVREDVIAAGGNISILSSVGDDVRVAGGNVIIQGKVGGDLIIGGGQINVGGPGVEGDTVIGGGDIRIDAPVKGKLTVRGGSVFINAPIYGDIDIEADVVKLGSSAVISGDLTYTARRELEKDPKAVVNGKINFQERPLKKVPAHMFAAIFSALLLWKFFALLACALLFGLVFHRYSKEVVVLATRRPLLELGRGLVTLAAMPIISILLLTTLVGIPIGILGLFGFAALMLFAWVVTPIVIGSVVYGYFSKRDVEVSWKTILTGALVCILLGLVPFIGWLVQSILFLITLGCIVSIKVRILKEWR